MNIACLGWGSLVWDPRELPLRGAWFQDGPLLPIEFARQSRDGRLTLVLVPRYPTKVRSLWGLLSSESVQEARDALQQREDVPDTNKEAHIKAWSAGDPPPADFPEISMWSEHLALDAVVWTGLPPKVGRREVLPNADEAVEHLRGLAHEQRRNAERYVRMTPIQVDTPYRRRFEKEFGWTASTNTP